MSSWAEYDSRIDSAIELLKEQNELLAEVLSELRHSRTRRITPIEKPAKRTRSRESNSFKVKKSVLRAILNGARNANSIQKRLRKHSIGKISGALNTLTRDGLVSREKRQPYGGGKKRWHYRVIEVK